MMPDTWPVVHRYWRCPKCKKTYPFNNGDKTRVCSHTKALHDPIYGPGFKIRQYRCLLVEVCE